MRLQIQSNFEATIEKLPGFQNGGIAVDKANLLGVICHRTVLDFDPHFNALFNDTILIDSEYSCLS